MDLRQTHGRQDVHAYNEATAFTLSPVFPGSARLGIDRTPEQTSWNRAIRECQLIPMKLASDNSFVVRIVRGELSKAEDSDWIARTTWKLDLPDGKLVLGAGTGYVCGHEQIGESEYVHLIDVPPGSYRVSVLTCLAGVNGTWVLAKADQSEPLGTWFRRTRPGEKFPPWLACLCMDEPEQDPGHELDWESLSEDDYVRLEETLAQLPPIDFIVQLEPSEGEKPAEPERVDGWYLEASEIRKPAHCPRGVNSTKASVGAADPHADDAASIDSGDRRADAGDGAGSHTGEDSSEGDGAETGCSAAGKAVGPDPDGFHHREEGNLPETVAGDTHERFEALNDRIQEAMAVPIGALVFQGREASFHEPDPAGLPPGAESELRSLDALFGRLDFVVAGDLVCDRTRDVLIRGYAHPGMRTFGAVLIGASGERAFDFYTQFDDGLALTTTTMRGTPDSTDDRTYRRSVPDADLPTLLRSHLLAANELEGPGRLPLPAEATREALAAIIDELLSRETTGREGVS